jgi:hypothetical protein
MITIKLIEVHGRTYSILPMVSPKSSKNNFFFFFNISIICETF